MYPQPRACPQLDWGVEAKPEPWVRITILNFIALKEPALDLIGGRCLPPGFYNALSGLGNLKCNTNPGLRFASPWAASTPSLRDYFSQPRSGGPFIAPCESVFASAVGTIYL